MGQRKPPQILGDDGVEGESTEAQGLYRQDALGNDLTEEGALGAQMPLAALGVGLHGVGDVIAQQSLLAVVEEVVGGGLAEGFSRLGVSLGEDHGGAVHPPQAIEGGAIPRHGGALLGELSRLAVEVGGGDGLRRTLRVGGDIHAEGEADPGAEGGISVVVFVGIKAVDLTREVGFGLGLDGGGGSTVGLGQMRLPHLVGQGRGGAEAPQGQHIGGEIDLPRGESALQLVGVRGDQAPVDGVIHFAEVVFGAPLDGPPEGVTLPKPTADEGVAGGTEEVHGGVASVPRAVPIVQPLGDDGGGDGLVAVVHVGVVPRVGVVGGVQLKLVPRPRLPRPRVLGLIVAPDGGVVGGAAGGVDVTVPSAEDALTRAELGKVEHGVEGGAFGGEGEGGGEGVYAVRAGLPFFTHIHRKGWLMSETGRITDGYGSRFIKSQNNTVTITRPRNRALHNVDPIGTSNTVELLCSQL